MTRECVLPEIYHLAGTQAAKLSGIRRIYAHPNAFSACQNFLERMPGVDLIVTFDAAATALQLARRKDAAEATVCSDFAAKIHGFSIIQRGIQSDAEAESRFIALGRHLETPPANATEIHTAILFVLRNEPGQLHRVLGILKDRGINVHVLGSRPTHVNRWEYAIGLELEGRAQDEGLQQAMTELKNATVYLQLLGSYYRVETQKSGRFSPTA
jgi:chorismate mutase/prephenate dehydratase